MSPERGALPAFPGPAHAPVLPVPGFLYFSPFWYYYFSADRDNIREDTRDSANDRDNHFLSHTASPGNGWFVTIQNKIRKYEHPAVHKRYDIGGRRGRNGNLAIFRIFMLMLKLFITFSFYSCAVPFLLPLTAPFLVFCFPPP